MNSYRFVCPLILTLFCVITLSAQEKMDSVFFLSGKVDAVKIIRNSSEEIDCNYPNEDIITTISKSKIAKIVFRSGRIEICNDPSEELSDKLFFANGDVAEVKVLRLTDESVDYLLPGEDLTRNTYITLLSKIEFANGRIEEFGRILPVKVITNESQWRDVVVCYNPDDTKGLEKVREISQVSGWGGSLASGLGYNNAITLLQKEAARMKCGLILIVDTPNRNNTSYGAGVRVNATAYRLRTSDSPDNALQDLSDLSELAMMFVDGSVNKLSSFKSIRKAYDLSEEILKDIRNDNTDTAKKKYQVLQDWYYDYYALEKKDSNLENYFNRIEKRLK